VGLFSDPVEKGLQLYFRDDLRFIFRKMELEDTFLQEKNKEKTIIRGWKHFYRNQFPFVGYKNIPAGMVTMSFSRDVVLDPYKLVPEAEKPDKGIADLKGILRVTNIVHWLAEVGNARRLKIMAKRNKGGSYDRIVLFLGSGLMLEILVIVLILLQRRGGGG
jgi:hypothetical protein